MSKVVAACEERINAMKAEHNQQIQQSKKRKKQVLSFMQLLDTIDAHRVGGIKEDPLGGKSLSIKKLFEIFTTSWAPYSKKTSSSVFSTRMAVVDSLKSSFLHKLYFFK